MSLRNHPHISLQGHFMVNLKFDEATRSTFAFGIMQQQCRTAYTLEKAGSLLT